MKPAFVKLAALAALMMLAGTSANTLLSHDVPASDRLAEVPAIALGSARLRVVAHDSGFVLAELRVGELAAGGRFEPRELALWIDSAEVIAEQIASAGRREQEERLLLRTPRLIGADGSEVVFGRVDSDDGSELHLYVMGPKGARRLHAEVASHEAVRVLGSLRHAAKIAEALGEITLKS